MLLGDSFPWDMLGIKCYCFYRCFSYLYRVNPSRSLLLHIAIDVYCILLHCTCFTFEITHLLPLQRDVLFKHGHFLPEKKDRG